jgi:ankyrin repeat protein
MPIGEGKEFNEHKACLADLFITEPEEDLNKMRRTKGLRTSGTFSWFLESDELKYWFRPAKAVSDIEKNILWLHGNPGIGKSTMAMMLAEELPKKDYFSNSDSILSFYFCDSDSEYHKTATSLLRGALYQIIQKHPSFMEQIMPKYQVQGKRLFESFDGLWGLLMDIDRASNGTEMYCIVDALDECDPESQDTFLRQINQSFKRANETTQVPCRVHFLIISRRYSEIQSFLSIFRCVDLGSCKEIAADLRAMIQDKVQDLARRNAYPASVRERVSKILEERADGTFLWVGIVCSQLIKVRSKEAVEKLRAQPQGLYPLYRSLLNAAFKDNDSHSASQFKMLLMFVLFALRRLTVAEIAEACRLYLDEDVETRLKFTQEIIDSSRSLVFTDKFHVRLLHRSVKDFLMKEMSYFTAFKSNYIMSYRCIELISQYCRPGLDRSALESAYGFLGYSVLHWPEHASLAKTEFAIQKEHENFFQNTLGTWRCWLGNYNHSQRSTSDALGLDTSVIQVAARLGIVPLISTTHQEALEDKDDHGQSPLLIAAENTQIEALRVLAESNVRFDSLNNKHQNVLHVACSNGRFNDCAMIKYLIDKGASPYICDEENMTPFLYAIGDRRTELARTFLNHGFNLEFRAHRREWPGQITLGSFYGIVERQDENIESGLTALHFAALNALTEMANLLLQCGANPNARSDFGDTALHLAIRRRLLGRKNDDAWEVGQYAVESLTDLIDDHEGSEASDIYQTISDTRLLIVETLLKSESINVKIANNHGDYPQHVIDFHRPQALSILKKLMEKGADASQPNRARQTCLHLASKAGNIEVIRKLVEEGNDIMLEDSDGRSPFNYAVSSGSLDTIAFLSKACDRVLSVVWKSLDHFGRSPLHHHVASVFCSVQVVSFLVQLGCDVNLPDGAGNTILGLYMNSFHLSIESEIFHLLIQEGSDPLCIDEYGQTLAHLIMHHKGADTTILDYLFAVGVDPATRDIDGKTLMHHGAIHGVFTEDLMDFLACKGVLDVCATATDLVYKTPLDYAGELADQGSSREMYYDGRWEESLKSLNATLLSRYDFFHSNKRSQQLIQSSPAGALT